VSYARRSVAVAIAVGREVQRQQVTFLAAALAYYAFVSLLPLLVLTLVVGSALGGESLAVYLVDATGEVLAPTGQDIVRNAVLNAAGQGQATVIGVALLGWSGLKFFRGLDIAFSRVYAPGDTEGLLEQLHDAVIVLVTIGAAVLVVVALGGVAPFLYRVPFANLLTTLVLPVALAAAFFPIYYVFPDVPLRPREVLPGTITVAVSWTVLTELFRVYAANAGQYSVYGVLGAVLLFVTWLYLAGIVIILGGILNAVLAGRTTDAEGADADGDGEPGGPAPDVVELEEELEELRERVDERTVDRGRLESELKGYVRNRIRRGHARGWGPYIVLLYGTAMTVAAFFRLDGGWAIAAMLVVWLSTLGLYALMLLTGVGLSAAGLPGRILDRVR
jgi:YihY family inner membrane protein